MEYIFGAGSLTENELLKTKGETFTDLSGRQEVVREYPDCVQTDRFVVVRKVGEDTDAEGNCYTWYEIVQHYTLVDKTPAVAAKLEYLAMMTGVELEEDTEAEGMTEEESNNE